MTAQLQDEAHEQESVDLLTSMMGSGDSASDQDVARRVLRKFNGDMQKAATAILEGDHGDPVSTPRPGTPARITEVKPYSPPRKS